jgi:hypothetical protein
MQSWLRAAFGILLFAGSALAGPVNMFSTDIVVPGAGRGPGAAGSSWITDLWIRCPGGGSVTLEFHAMDSVSAAATASTTLSMTGPVAYLPDVLLNNFSLQSGVGNIRIIPSSPATATIRVYSSGSGGGSYGFAFMGMPSAMGMESFSGMMGQNEDEHRYYVAGLLPEPAARVNTMVVNSSSSAISGSVDVLDADDSDPSSGPRSYSFSIQPYSSHQFLDVLAGVHSRFPGDTGLQLRIHLDDGTPGMMMALATVVDNVTNDAYVVMGSMMDAATMMGQGGGMP